MKNLGLIPRSEQAAHSEKVRVAILTFLADETYSITDVIQKLIGFKSQQGAKGVLKKLSKDGLVKHHSMKNLAGRGLHLWGITARGIYAIYDPDELPERVRGFEPSRISLATLDHKIQIQLIKIYLIELDWSIEQIDPIVWDKKLPDIVTTKPSNRNELIALEVELTIKSKKRYADIITTYKSVQKNTPSLRRVVWLTDNEKAAAQLHSIFKNLDEGSINLHKFMSLDKFQGKNGR